MRDGVQIVHVEWSYDDDPVVATYSWHGQDGTQTVERRVLPPEIVAEIDRLVGQYQERLVRSMLGDGPLG